MIMVEVFSYPFQFRPLKNLKTCKPSYNYMTGTPLPLIAGATSGTQHLSLQRRLTNFFKVQRKPLPSSPGCGLAATVESINFSFGCSLKTD
jgi:hypothetical protein